MNKSNNKIKLSFSFSVLEDIWKHEDRMLQAIQGRNQSTEKLHDLEKQLAVVTYKLLLQAKTVSEYIYIFDHFAPYLILLKKIYI